MYQRAIDRQTWATIFHELSAHEQRMPGMWLVTIGKHPDLGCITAVEDEHDMIMLLAENPLGARDEHYPANRVPLRLVTA